MVVEGLYSATDQCFRGVFVKYCVKTMFLSSLFDLLCEGEPEKVTVYVLIYFVLILMIDVE